MVKISYAQRSTPCDKLSQQLSITESSLEEGVIA